MIDISEQPMEVAPTAHYSMGGIVVEPDEHFTGVEGLYAAGEVAGGLHGANRLGGNSLAEILIFGKRAGQYAAKRSLEMDVQYRSREVIKAANDKISSFIKPGSEVARPLQRELRNIMWEHCGVVRSEEKLESGLRKISALRESVVNLDVRPDSEGFEDLALAFDLEASLLSAEATVLGAIERKESRGSHQRSDFPDVSSEYDCTFRVSLDSSQKPVATRHDLLPLSDELRECIERTKEIDIDGKLLE
jgi:succinate dehydrogenase / fumarate reductase flavoprotein subunit